MALSEHQQRLTLRHTGDKTYAESYYGVGKDQFRPNPNTVQTAKIGYTRAISPILFNEAAIYLNRMDAFTQNAGTIETQNFPEVVFGSGVPFANIDLQPQQSQYRSCCPEKESGRSRLCF